MMGGVVILVEIPCVARQTTSPGCQTQICRGYGWHLLACQPRPLHPWQSVAG
jgi:hypothetical protein